MPSSKTNVAKLPLKDRGAILGPSGVVGGLRDGTDYTGRVRSGPTPRRAPGAFANGALNGRRGRRSKTY